MPIIQTSQTELRAVMPNSPIRIARRDSYWMLVVYGIECVQPKPTTKVFRKKLQTSVDTEKEKKMYPHIQDNHKQ